MRDYVIELSDMRDYVKLLNGPNNSPVWYIEHHPMRVFKWTPDFDPFFESPITTLWCNILALPVHLFEESSLIAIGEMLGKPVQVDRATINRTRVSFARLCVEVDLSRPIVEEIDIDIAGKHVTLKVKWEKIPLYCNECKHVGHSALTCYASGKRPMPPKRDYSRGPTHQNRQPHGTEGQPRHTEQPRQPQEPRRAGQHFAAEQQINGNLFTERPPSKESQPHHPERRDKEKNEPPSRSDFFTGSTSAAAEGSQAVVDDGFITTKKKKTKSAAARERGRVRYQEKKQAKAAELKAASDGEGHRGEEADQSSSESERGSRSLSPTSRSGNGFGPLAIVVRDNNMFGALEDAPSDDNAESDEPQDQMIVDGSTRRIIFARPAVEYMGPEPSSPPLEGASKKPRLSASGDSIVSHV